MNKYISYHIDDNGRCSLNINRPPVNALSSNFINELSSVFNDINKNRKCKIVIIHSFINNFCAGADLKERKIISLDGADNALDTFIPVFPWHN